MSSQSRWVSKFAVMRDLSLAQGCVPVALADVVKAGDRPPSRNMIEETEEELYRNWVAGNGNGDFSAPDLGLIKQLLEEARSHDVPNVTEEDFEKIIQISKLNPLCQEFKPEAVIITEDKLKKNTQKTKQNRKERNVALQSILQNLKNNIAANPIDIKDSKQSDVKKTDITKAEHKVSFWLETPVKSPVCKKTNNVSLQLSLDPSSMFKKKNVGQKAVKLVKEVKSTSSYNYNKYVPSDSVDEYYKQFLECSRMKQLVQENVWTKVERQMKDIDERRAAEAELFAMSLALCREQGEVAVAAPDPIKQKLGLVYLPHHRHSLPEPCRVCDLWEARQQIGSDAVDKKNGNNISYCFEKKNAVNETEAVINNQDKGSEADDNKNANNVSYRFEISKSEQDVHDSKSAVAESLSKVSCALNARLQKLLKMNALRFDYVLNKRAAFFNDDKYVGDDDDDDDGTDNKLESDHLEALDSLSDSDDLNLVHSKID